MNTLAVTHNIHQNNTYPVKNIYYIENKQNSLTFTSNVNFSSPIQDISKETEQSLNLYMNKILTSTIQTTDENIREYYAPIFKKLMLVSKTENDFYEKLAEKVRDFISNGSFIQSNNRKSCYAERTLKMLEGQKLPPNAIYVDIGCGNGVVTKSISDSLNISANNVYGLEIFEPNKIEGLNVIKYDGYNIPKSIPNADFTTLYTVLHHMENEEQASNLLKSIYSKMNANGYLLIREHEVNNKQDSAFWKIVHDINTKVMKRTSADLNNGILYKSSDEWIAQLQDAGFKFIKKWYDLSYNKQRSYFLLVRK